MVVSSPAMRMVWKVVEDTSSQDLLALSDTALIALVLRQITKRAWLDAEEVSSLYEYIGSKLALIRDCASFPMAEQR